MPSPTKLFWNLYEAIPFHCDYEGQKLSEYLMNIMMTVTSIVAFAIGYLNQKMSHSLMTMFIGLAITAFITLPPWPFYARHPLKWQKHVEPEEQDPKKD